MSTKALQIIQLVADVIKEVKHIPSGHLYAQMMPYKITVGAYNGIINILKQSGLVVEKNHELFWVGEESNTKAGAYDKNLIKKN